MSTQKTQSFALLSRPAEIREDQMYTGMRLQVSGPGSALVVWEDVQGKFVRREAADYYGGTVRAIFLDRTFPTGQVVQVGLNSRARTIRVDIGGTWHQVTTLAC